MTAGSTIEREKNCLSEREQVMKQSVIISLVVVMSVGILCIEGCGSDKQNKALIGGAIGAGVGQAVGRDTKGTLIGAGVGAGAGYVLGKDEPKQQAPPQGYSQPPQQGYTQPPTVSSQPVSVWVTNSNGSQTEVKLTPNPDGSYTGPKGERYATMPNEEQLKKAYGF
jgi:hypothetical protein